MTHDDAIVAIPASNHTDYDTPAGHRPASLGEANVDVLTQFGLDKCLLGLEMTSIQSYSHAIVEVKRILATEGHGRKVSKESTPARCLKPLATSLAVARTALPESLTFQQ